MDTSYESYEDLLSDLEDSDNVYKINGRKTNSPKYSKKIIDSIISIFGFLYQFSHILVQL